MKKQGAGSGFIVILIVAAVALVTWAVLQKDREKYNWSKTYTDGMREPYDFGVFKALLSRSSVNGFSETERDLISKMGDLKEKKDPCYIFTGRYLYLTREETDSLLSFAASGKRVLIAAEGIPDTLLTLLSHFAGTLEMERMDEASVTVESFYRKGRTAKFRFTHRSFGNEPDVPCAWYYLKKGDWPFYSGSGSGRRSITLGRLNGNVHFAKFRYGRGYIFIHTAPMLFTNYAIGRDTGFLYANDVISAIGKGHFLWDDVSREEKEDASRLSRRSDSPLSYILSHPPLRTAWYLFMSLVVLFFLFRARRRQRIIPIAQKKRNTTMAFTESISRLYYRHADHRLMAETEMQLFMAFIRNRLGIHAHDHSQVDTALVSRRSKVSLKDTERIFSYYLQVISGKKAQTDPEVLMEFHRRIRRFYKIYKENK